jgi:hypothetical protein
LEYCQICGRESGDRQMCRLCETLINQELQIAEYADFLEAFKL